MRNIDIGSTLIRDPHGDVYQKNKLFVIFTRLAAVPVLIKSNYCCYHATKSLRGGMDDC